ncbi:MAG: DUF86 domain-containing protein [Azospira sp.]|jgi:uncharacterized protein with HEPN domain|nr:DUF86 domain-containing protein [Azospira sp.]
MTKDALLFLRHALLCIHRIREYTAGHTESTFLTNQMTQDAVIRNLEVIGQCIKDHGLAPLQSLNPDIRWRTIAAFRNVLAHQYMGVKPDLVWRVVIDELPALENAIEEILAE